MVNIPVPTAKYNANTKAKLIDITATTTIKCALLLGRLQGHYVAYFSLLE